MCAFRYATMKTQFVELIQTRRETNEKHAAAMAEAQAALDHVLRDKADLLAEVRAPTLLICQRACAIVELSQKSLVFFLFIVLDEEINAPIADPYHCIDSRKSKDCTHR